MLLIIILGLVLLFAFTNGLHDPTNVVVTIITTRAVPPKKALLMAAFCEFIAPLFIGSAVARMIGRNIINTALFDSKSLPISATFITAALLGAIGWNLITWGFGLPSSSSHALVGGMVGAALIAFGARSILWKGLLYVIFSLIISPILGLIFGLLLFKGVLHFSKNATPRANSLFNRMQIPSSIALALSHGANDVQKSIGLIYLSLLLFGYLQSFDSPLWVV